MFRINSPSHSLFRVVLTGFLVASLLFSGCAFNRRSVIQHPSGVKIGNAKVLLMPLDVQISELTAGGVVEPKAEWTEQSERNLVAALSNLLIKRHITLAPIDAQDLEQEDVFQRIKLMQTVGTVVLLSTFTAPGSLQSHRLPTKKDEDWTVGDTMHVLKEKYGTDYALFLNMRDHFSTGGRVALGVVFALVTLGRGVMSGGRQTGYAYLVDLNSGNVAWHALLTGSGFGDVREPEGAQKAVENLFQTFPSQ